MSDLWIEGTVPHKLSEHDLGGLAREGEFPLRLAEHLGRRGIFPPGQKLYSHQEESLRASNQTGARPAVIVTAGTGGGKTEAFLFPMLQAIEDAPRQPFGGVQALILYPMNALVNDQVDRLTNWLAGQKHVRFAHFTSDTPEDWAHAGRMGVPEWDESRCRTRRQARGLETHKGKKIDDPAERLSVPNILITNYSMLEYMLARPQDRVFFGSDLQVVVLDEAHLYTGTLAAELTLLLRRTLERCGKRAEDVLHLATSATIGTGADEELLEFTSVLFSKPRWLVKLLRGVPAEPDWPAPRAPRVEPSADSFLDADRNELSLRATTIRLLARQDRQEEELVVDERECRQLAPLLATLVEEETVQQSLRDCQGQVAGFLHGCLRHAPVMQRLDQLLRGRRFQTVPQLSHALLGQDDARGQEVALRLLSLGSAARLHLKELPLIPHRLHLMVRPASGLSVCLSAGCSGVRWPPFGCVQDGNRDVCEHCGHLVLSLLRCSNCGEAALAADRSGGKVVAHQPRGFKPRAAELVLCQAGRQGTPYHLDALKGRPVGPGMGTELTLVEECPNCGDELDAFRAVATPGGFFQSIVAETLLAGVPPLVGEHPPHILPAEGRRLLAFSDSRAEAARLGPRLRVQHEQQVVRAALVDLLREGGGADPAVIAYRRAQLADLQKKLTPELPETLAREIRADMGRVEAELLALEQGGTIADWGRKLGEHKLLEQLLDFEGGERHQWKEWSQRVWAANHARVRLQAEMRLGNELAAPNRRRFNNLETIGWAEITYPGLDLLGPPEGFLGELPRRARQSLAPAWTELLAALLDCLRGEFAITLGSRERDLLWRPGDVPYGPWFERPRFIGKQRRQRLRRFLRAVLVQAGMDGDEAEKTAAEVLAVIFDQLAGRARDRLKSEAGSGQLPWLEVYAGYVTEKDGVTTALRLRFPELGLRRPTRLYRCQVNGRVWPRSVLGCSPDPGSEVTLEEIAPEELDRTPPFSRARLEYAQSPVFRIGLWAEEHSAQLSPAEGRRLQELFRAGLRNLLSATTTMELGIDIGGLSAAFLSNVPPGKANYLQRAGRVGRRADGSSIVVTGARTLPYDREVFQRMGDFFGRSLRKPQVFLDRIRVVTRHLHAWLMGAFFGQLYRPTHQVGAMRAFGQMGSFCGRAVPDRVDRHARPRPELIPRPRAVVEGEFIPPVWWDQSAEQPEDGLVVQFRRFTAYVRGPGRGQLQPLLTELFRGTVLNLESAWDATLQAAEDQFAKITSDWLREYDQLVGSWLAAEDARLANSLRYQLGSLAGVTVIEALADAQFLPRYGFPIGLLRLRVVLDDQDLREQREEDRYRLERPGLLALREYVPGSEILVGGRLITSRGLLKHWTGENLDEAFGLQILARECRFNHFYYTTGRDLGPCPICADPPETRIRTLLLPRHGFSTAKWDPPQQAAQASRVGSVERATITFQKDEQELQDQNFGAIPGLVARYASEGEILVYNQGAHECGFAICTRCGFADSEKKLGQQAMHLPKGFADHLPLHQKDGPRCWKDDQVTVLRNRDLAARQTTDVLLLDWSRVLGRELRDEILVLTLTVALQLAGARLLELDSRELGSMVVPLRPDEWGGVVYDNVPGGAGHVLELYRLGSAWLREAERLLFVSPEHDQRCNSACLDCLMSIDAQILLTEARLERRRALGALRSALGAAV